MTGPLHILQGQGGGHSNGNCLVVNQDSTKGGSISRWQQDGTDVLKVNAQGQLECQNNRIIQVGDPEAGTDAINLRTFEQRGQEDFVLKDGDTMTGQLIINAPREGVATNSFIIKGNLGGKEGQTLLKDYRDKKENGADSSIMYFGRTTADAHITTKKWVVTYIDEHPSIPKHPPGPGNVYHTFKYYKTPPTSGSEWAKGDAAYDKNEWFIHSYSYGQDFTLQYDGKGFVLKNPQPYIVWLQINGYDYWSKSEAGLWTEQKWNNTNQVVFKVQDRQKFRDVKPGELICTQFTGFW